jgi:CelD/BcsL family acetyltransferase involved in cellulose biosynthesis
MRCDFAIAAPALLLHQYGSFEELVQSLPRSQRSEVRRNLNRVKNWNPQLKVFRRTDVAGALEMFEGMLIAYQAQHWGRRQLFISPQKVEFYQEVIRVGLPAGWLHVSILEVDSRPISWFLGFDWNDTLSWYRFCYAVDAENLSPGRLHLCFLLMRGFEEGLKVFDLLIGDEPYKMKWTSFTRSFYRLMWYPPNLLGSMSYLGSHVAKAWPRLSG